MENWEFVERCECLGSWVGYEDYISAVDGRTIKRVWDDGTVEYFVTA